MQYALYHPADKPIKPEKIISLNPDWIILDLQESVRPEAHAVARKLLGFNISQVQKLDKNCAVRINSLANTEGETDLAFLKRLNLPAPILLPKPVAPDYLTKIAQALPYSELWVMGEEIGFGAYCHALSDAFDHLTTVVIGAKSLSQNLSIVFDPEDQLLRKTIENILVRCHAAGLRVFDNVAFGEPKIVQRAATNAFINGFDGMTFLRSHDLAQARSAMMS